jgi:hypothetical protein
MLNACSSKQRTQFNVWSLNETRSVTASMLWRANWHIFVSEPR